MDCAKPLLYPWMLRFRHRILMASTSTVPPVVASIISNFFLGTSLALFATPEFWHGREQEKRFPGYTAYSKRDRLVNDGGIGFPSNEAFGPEHINSAG